MQPPFEKLPGVSKVLAGYAGGTGADPTYSDYAEKGYVEAVEIKYDPSQISYGDLLNVFWRQINPTDAGGQFVDRGPQYRSVIFYHNDEQKRLAEKSKADLAASGRFSQPIVTEIIPATTFTKAEEYHQDYHSKNPTRYSYYRWRSGRDQFLDKTWGADRTVTVRRPPQAAAAPVYRKFTKEEAQEKTDAAPVQGHPRERHGAGLPQRLLGQSSGGYLRRHRVGRAALQFGRQIRLRHRLAEFHASRWNRRTSWKEHDRGWFSTRTEVRSAHADSHLGARLQRRPAADRTALLHELGGAAVRPRRGPREGRVRTVPAQPIRSFPWELDGLLRYSCLTIGGLNQP